MLKDFFIPTPSNHYYPIGIRPKFLYTYLVFMIIFNLFAARFLIYFPSTVSADATFSPSDIIALANQDRVQNNLPVLSENSLLDNAASAKADDMFKYQYWAHYNPTTGASPWQFIVAAGYNYHYAGENLAEGFSNAQGVNTAWMNSADHKANILGTNFKDIGVAVKQGQLLNSNTILVVEMFGSLQVQPTPNSTPPVPQQPNIIGNTAKITPTVIQPVGINIQNNLAGNITITPSVNPTTSVSITPTQIPQPTITTTGGVKGTSNVVENIKVKIDGIQFSNRVNFLVGIFLMLLFAMDSIYYYRVREIHKNNRPSSIAHLPLLTILVIICIIGTTGITL